MSRECEFFVIGWKVNEYILELLHYAKILYAIAVITQTKFKIIFESDIEGVSSTQRSSTFSTFRGTPATKTIPPQNRS